MKKKTLTYEHKWGGTLPSQCHRPDLKQAHRKLSQTKNRDAHLNIMKTQNTKETGSEMKIPTVYHKVLSTHNEECILKVVSETLHIISKGKPIRTAPDFSKETLEEPWAIPFKS